MAFAGATVLLLVGYAVRFGADAMTPAALVMNITLFAATLIFAAMARSRRDAVPVVTGMRPARS
jgi:hypothetical protein